MKTQTVTIEFLPGHILEGLTYTSERPRGLKVGQVVKECTGKGKYRVIKVVG
jgi:hypothetical protein